MWELDYKESWELKNWCFWTVLESPLDFKEIQPVNPKGNQSWIFIGRTDAEPPILCDVSPPDVKNWLTGKNPDAGKDWWQEEKRATEDEMVGRHHRLSGHEFEQAPGVGNGVRSLVCWSPQSRKESDMTEQLNWSSPLNWDYLAYVGEAESLGCWRTAGENWSPVTAQCWAWGGSCRLWLYFQCRFCCEIGQN